ncbi:MAG: hypothetical protein LBT86_02855 [Deltaproteobacteria bacterium]|jgi:hypothetical protein|nr:hypothetical protein [Deltaproteobacteria bacterium]
MEDGWGSGLGRGAVSYTGSLKLARSGSGGNPVIAGQDKYNHAVDKCKRAFDPFLGLLVAFLFGGYFLPLDMGLTAERSETGS